jgi:hypothetical protein
MATPNPKEFLQRVLPWPEADEPGFINMHAMANGSNGQQFLTGSPTKNVDQFLQEVHKALRWRNSPDIYMCLSRQAQTKPADPKGRIRAAKSQEQALGLKSIYLDIDVKAPPKGYATTTEAANALFAFCAAVPLPMPSAVIASGSGGLHVYWISDRMLTPDEWQPYAEGLKTAAIKHGLRCDAGVTADSARILRVPSTFNHKSNPPKPVRLLGMRDKDYDFATELAILPTIAPTVARSALQGRPSPKFAGLPVESLAEGIREEFRPLHWEPVAEQCAFIGDALKTGGRDYSQPMWNLTTLAATFFEDGSALAHRMGSQHPGYAPESTKDLWDRKNRERKEHGLGWPSCKAIQDAGCSACAKCPHFGKIKSPLNLALQQQTQPQTPPPEPSFVDPYAEFAGPVFPMDVLPPTLAKFVDAEHRAMGADPSALAMAVLTVVAGAMHAEARIRVGEGWWERPILWTVLVGPPSAMKSPIIESTTKPLFRIDHARRKVWDGQYAQWVQLNKGQKQNSPPPAKPPRCIIIDTTPEKVAEILSRDTSGSLMVHDELAGFIGSFERYSAGASSRGQYLTSWNGGPFLKDRVGKGKHDQDAEIRLDNLALGILGGIQPDRLVELGDLTSDGLLQRFLPVLMQSAARGDQYHPVATERAAYEQLIQDINGAAPQNYHYADDALEIRDRVIDYLHTLEQVDGFPAALIGAIGKLKGYFARICLVLHVARQHDPIRANGVPDGFPEWATRAEGERISRLMGLDPTESLAAGITSSVAISRQTAEAAETLLRQFLLPHICGFYDVVVNGGADRGMVRSIANFILASDLTRMRPSDITAGVRALRGQPDHKIRDWAGRFCALGWLQTEEQRPGAPPKAWWVAVGLREHFAERRKQAEAARAQAHAILKAGGSRKPS